MNKEKLENITLQDINALQIMRGKPLSLRAYILHIINSYNERKYYTLASTEKSKLCIKVMRELGFYFDIWRPKKEIPLNYIIICEKDKVKDGDLPHYEKVKII